MDLGLGGVNNRQSGRTLSRQGCHAKAKLDTHTAAATLHSSQLARRTDTRSRHCGISDVVLVIEDIETALPWPF